MKLYTYKTAAEVLDCSPSKVQKMCLAGELPILKVGNETRIREEDLRAFIDAGLHYHQSKNAKIFRDPNRKQAVPTKESVRVVSK